MKHSFKESYAKPDYYGGEQIKIVCTCGDKWFSEVKPHDSQEELLLRFERIEHVLSKEGLLNLKISYE